MYYHELRDHPPLSIVSTYTLVLMVLVYPVSAVSISASAAYALLLYLPPVLTRFPTTATALALPSEIDFLEACTTVIEIADVVRSHLFLEW